MANGPVRHMLVGRFRSDASEDLFQTFIGAFRELARTIEGVLSFEYGVNNSPEGLNRGMTHVITLTFRDAATRDAYLLDAEHRRFAEWAGQLNLVEELLVIDYVAQG